MSPMPTPLEPEFVRDWVLALRNSDDPRLREVGVLVRPHPERMKEWINLTLDGIENVVMQGGTPIDSSSKADYYDALAYSGAVVGLCTSAFLEAAIAGRPVLTLLMPQYRIHQDGMAHFRYLLNVEGGLLHAASDVTAHLRDLSDVLAKPKRTRRTQQAFPLRRLSARRDSIRQRRQPSLLPSTSSLECPAGSMRDLPASRPRNHSWEWVAHQTHAGIGEWLMMDAVDMARARQRTPPGGAEARDQEKRALYYATKARAREEQSARAHEHEQRLKEWSKWRRGLSARKQLARLKGGLKQLVGLSRALMAAVPGASRRAWCSG